MNQVYFPIRDPQHKNFLSLEQYQLDSLPPFALGNFYVLSGALGRYLARNADVLRPTGTLEDVSIAVWMMGLQVGKCSCRLVLPVFYSLYICIILF
jgi:hypothetical protein